MAQESLLRELGIRVPLPQNCRGPLGYASRNPSSLAASEDITVQKPNCERLSFDLAGFGESAKHGKLVGIQPSLDWERAQYSTMRLIVNNNSGARAQQAGNLNR